jgi:FkbM family methyltransferase
MIKKLFLLLYNLKYPKKIKFGRFTFKFRSSRLTQGMKKDLNLNIDNYEIGERILIEKYIKEGDIVVEAGTSIGLITGMISNLIGPKGYIFTIEGDKNLVAIAQDINKLNNNVHFFNGILVFTDETYFEFVNDGWLGGHKLKDSNIFDKKITLSKAISCFHLVNSLRANVLILDIEGEEENILLYDIPNIINKIIIELHPNMYKVNSNDLLVNYFKKQGFSQKENIQNVYSFIREN